jgi:predicted metal-dependent hydrolase
MSTEPHRITVGGLLIDVVRKPIKNLHMGVYPPNGRIRVAAPVTVSDDAVRLAVVSRMGWIKRQQAKFEAQARQSQRAYVSGESHFFLGRRYRLTSSLTTERHGYLLGPAPLLISTSPKTVKPSRGKGHSKDGIVES